MTSEEIKREVKRYRMVFDYHTHTTYSHGFITPHGKGTVEENVETAISKGLKGLAISDHGPGHIFYGIKRDKIPDLRRDIEEAKKKHPEIELYMSCETNVIEAGTNLDVDNEEAKKFDFLIGGYHYGVLHGHMLRNWITAKKGYQNGGDNGLVSPEGEPLSTSPSYEKLREINTEMYLGALKNNDLKILTHPGDKGPIDMKEVAKACAETGTWMEISTWHMHLTVKEIEICMKEDVKFVISSDAHTPDRVGSFEGGLVRALMAGLDPARIVNIEKID